MDVITQAITYTTSLETRLYSLTQPLPELFINTVIVEGEEVELTHIKHHDNSYLGELLEWQAWLEISTLDDLETVFISDRYKQSTLDLYREFPDDPEVQDMYLDLVMLGVFDDDLEKENLK